MSLTVDIRHASYESTGTGESVLREVSFTLDRGESVAVLGRNGSGKSSLGYVVTGILPRLMDGTVDGEVRVDGALLSTTSTEAWLAKVGILFQDCDAQFFSLRLADEFPDLEVVEHFQLQDLMDRSPAELSMGQRQKAALAIAVARKPRCLVLDEPGTTLDPPSQRQLTRLLKSLRASGVQLLLLSQRPTGVFEIADRVLGLKCGTLRLDTSGTSLSPVALADLFDIEPDDAHPQPSLGRATPAGPELVLCERMEFAYRGGRFRLDLAQPLSVAHGSTLGLVGANGSGKSTLLCLLGGLARARRGGSLISVNSSKPGHRTAIVFQNPNHQLFARSIREELRFGLENHSVSPTEIERRIEWGQEFFGLGDLERDPHTLSYGQKKILALACAFVLEPDVVLLDEPELGLDLYHRAALKRLIHEWQKTKGTVFVIATHDLQLIRQETDRLVLLSDGRITCSGPTNEVIGEVHRHFGLSEGDEW